MFDTNYYWADRVRIHVPILTSPVIESTCNERSVQLPAGEAGSSTPRGFTTCSTPTGDECIHLVADTVGSANVPDLVASRCPPSATTGGTSPCAAPHRPP